MIPGPKAQPELKRNFLTNQALSAKDLAHEHGFEYHACGSENDLDEALKAFFSPSNTGQIIEVHSEIEQNTTIFEAFKSLTNYGQ